jgi:hypothetical protein
MIEGSSKEEYSLLDVNCQRQTGKYRFNNKLPFAYLEEGIIALTSPFSEASKTSITPSGLTLT